VLKSEVHVRTPQKAGGFLDLEKAEIEWFLSIDKNDLPSGPDTGTFRSLVIDGKELEFSSGFTDLHTALYRKILAGEGFGIDEARPSIELTCKIRQAEISGIKKNSHPGIKK
jgi:UDP-N-acetyl-2-amino-2-deoxyglucuronate dehydrogenase